MKGCFLSNIFQESHSNLVAFNFVDEKRTVTYFDLIEKSRVIQSFLNKQGITHGDQVLVSFEEEDLFISAFIAVMSLGAVMIPVGPLLTNHELQKISKILPIKYSLSKYSFVKNHEIALATFPDLEGIITLDDPGQDLNEALLPLHSKVGPPRKREKINIPESHQVVTCHMTMKGFGNPLGVEHTYETYSKTIQSCHHIFKFVPGRKVLTILPSYPVFGLVTNLLYPLMAGCELIIQDKKMGNILKAIQTYNIEHMNVVPVILEKMLLESSKQEKGVDLSKLVVVAGGSYVSPELHQECLKKLNLSPVQGYGLTETLPILTNHPGSARPGTLGLLMRDDVEMMITDAKGHEVPFGKAGEICFRGRGVITHYFGDNEIKDSLFRNGWLRTGDIGYLDDAGHVVFVGRRLNFTKISGNMVDLKEIEDLVKGLQGVKSARSYVFNEKGREKLSLSIFVTRDFAYTRKEILELCRQNLSSPKIPSQLKIFKSSYDEVNG